MNERIKELLGQAGFDVKRLLEPYPGGFPREDFLALESFAELIAKEYIELAYKEADHLDDNFERGRADDLRRWASVMKRHFGVK